MRRLAPSLFSTPTSFSPASLSLPNPKQNPKTTQSQKLKKADPTRASTAALSLFVARLLAGDIGGSVGDGSGEGEGGGEGSNAAAVAAAAEAASRLARRHLGVAEQLAAEKKAETKAAATEAPRAAATAGGEAPDDGSAGPHLPLSLSGAVRSLVAATLSHPRSKELYGSFPVTSKGWRRLPRVYGNSVGVEAEGKREGAGAAAAASAAAGPSSSSPPLPPALVAIDCEMVETEGGEQTDLARVAVAASIPLCWFEEEEGGQGEGEQEEEEEEEEEEAAKKEDGAAEKKKETANGNDSAPSLPPKQLLSPLEAAALSLRKAGYGPPHLVLSAAVAPSRKVSDWRRGITGLTRCSLAAAPMTRVEAQKAVAAAVARASGWREREEGDEEEGEAATLPPPLPAPAVLVGHALHHDLRALRLDAASGGLVIDTALLFGYEGLPRATPGLADLYAAVVIAGAGRGKSVGGGKSGGEESGSAAEVAPLRSPGAPHDCAADAVAALALAAEALAARVGSSGKNNSKQRITVPAPARKVERDELCKLLVHGLKPPTSSRDFDAAATVAALFETMPTGVARPRSVEAVLVAPEKETKETTGTKPAVATKAWAVFATPAEADAAFAALPLPNPGSPSSASVATDSLGRPQRLARIPARATEAAARKVNGEPSSSSLSSSPLSQVVRVRKAAAHAGMSHGRFKPAKRDRSAASVRHGREQQKIRRKSIG